MKRLKKALLMLLVIGILSYMYMQIAAKRQNNLYQGLVVVVDAGHGGKDGGAQFDGILEERLNLEIAKQVKEELESIGVQVRLTRYGHYDLASKDATNRKREDLQKRIQLINDKDVDLYISIHLNAYPNTGVKGAQVFYKKQDQGSQQLAKEIQYCLRKELDTKMKETTGDYYIVRNSEKTGVLVECGFLSNAIERELLQQKDYQRRIAKSIVLGIRKYLYILEV